MNAEIISNGDEITSGKVLDSNSQWLSRELMELGIRVLYHTTVGDDFDSMVNVLRVASSRVDLVIWTGGLGPTADDLTRQVLSKFAGVPLVLREDLLVYICSLFSQRGYAAPESNKIQAYIPQNATHIFNPQGTAPGIDLIVKKADCDDIDNCCGDGVVSAVLSFSDAVEIGFMGCVRILAFPGVPAELYEMWNNSVKGSLQEMLQKISGQKRIIKSRVINCFGAGESQIESMLPDIINRNHVPRVGITASRGTISLRIIAEAVNEIDCDKLILPVVELIYDKLSDLIFSEGGDQLQDVVCRKLNQLDKTVAVIESATGTRGKLAASIADSIESKSCFCGGVVLSSGVGRLVEDDIELCKSLFEADYILSIGSYQKLNLTETLNKNNSTAITIANVKNNKANVIIKENSTTAAHSDITDDLHIKRILNIFRKLLN
jgi:nicotinamide-nucleotide amidase